MAINSNQFKSYLTSGYAYLENNKQSVNDLNVFPVPDGDTGTNMSLTMQSAIKEAVSVSGGVGDVALSVSSGALMGARGNSGVILSQLFRGFSKGCMGHNTMDSSVLAQALSSAKQAAYSAVMKPTEGTILTVARMMSEFADKNYSKYTDCAKFLEDIVKVGEDALKSTPEMLDVLKEAGVVDAGGAGLMCIMKGAMLAAKGTPVSLKSASANRSTAQFEYSANSEIKYAYCTELLIRTAGKKKYRKTLIDKLMKIGDSLLVIEDGGIIKIHVHSNEPWNVMKIASVAGEFTKIKIDNMREQHSEIFETLTEGEQAHSEHYDKQHVPYALIAVSAGEGFSEILRGLGVNYIVSGGQTMNPSTQDFLDIIENTDADEYILLPNNKNIILACKQVKEVSKKNIHVLETRNIPQAITALMSFDPTLEARENMVNMEESYAAVRTGQVTFAVRDTNVNGVDIHKNDIIGLNGGEITVTGAGVSEACKKLIEQLLESPAAIVSIYYGENVKQKDAEKLKDQLAGEYPNVDFDVISGGQPLYYYIISAE
ncbi:MAG: DAK2 domain-containing protein [Eubacteriaceae bacterium]|nr:DAK2 domain-containing protein [Eubacteriaceae bacterium]